MIKKNYRLGCVVYDRDWNVAIVWIEFKRVYGLRFMWDCWLGVGPLIGWPY